MPSHRARSSQPEAEMLSCGVDAVRVIQGHVRLDSEGFISIALDSRLMLSSTIGPVDDDN